MKIACLSGKGGAGKTLTAVNLAAAAEKAVYIDCDVEEPNGHLFFHPDHVETETVCSLLPEFDAGAITAVNSVPNPGHRPGFLPNFLADHGAQVIISGGMGGGAVDIFNERGVEVIVGVQGDATAAVESYLKGELVSTGSICHEHEHADECGEHH